MPGKIVGHFFYTLVANNRYEGFDQKYRAGFCKLLQQNKVSIYNNSRRVISIEKLVQGITSYYNKIKLLSYNNPRRVKNKNLLFCKTFYYSNFA